MTRFSITLLSLIAIFAASLDAIDGANSIDCTAQCNVIGVATGCSGSACPPCRVKSNGADGSKPFTCYSYPDSTKDCMKLFGGSVAADSVSDCQKSGSTGGTTPSPTGSQSTPKPTPEDGTPPSPSESKQESDGGSSFFSSAGGIILIIILVIAAIGGVIACILLKRRNAEDSDKYSDLGTPAGAPYGATGTYGNGVGPYGAVPSVQQGYNVNAMGNSQQQQPVVVMPMPKAGQAPMGASAYTTGVAPENEAVTLQDKIAMLRRRAPDGGRNDVDLEATPHQRLDSEVNLDGDSFENRGRAASAESMEL